MKEEIERRQIRANCLLASSKITPKLPKQPSLLKITFLYTPAYSAGVTSNALPWPSKNRFTFLSLVGTNKLHVRTHKHTHHMEMDGSLSHTSIKKDDSISCHCCYEFANCGQLWINWHIFFLLFTDRYSSYFCYCIKAETVFTLRRLELCLSLSKSI